MNSEVRRERGAETFVGPPRISVSLTSLFHRLGPYLPPTSLSLRLYGMATRTTDNPNTVLHPSTKPLASPTPVSSTSAMPNPVPLTVSDVTRASPLGGAPQDGILGCGRSSEG